MQTPPTRTAPATAPLNVWSRNPRIAALAEALLFASLLWATYRSVAPASRQVAFPGIANFGQVDDRLSRGAQPELTAFAALKARGVNTVVRLNGGGAQIPIEQKQVESLGMRFVYLPWSSDALPSHEQVVTFLALLHDPATKAFVHCRAGADRTGVMVALYRIEFDHWTTSQAITEMNQFHYYFIFLPHLQRYVESFPATMNTDADLAKFQPPLSAVPR